MRINVRAIIAVLVLGVLALWSLSARSATPPACWPSPAANGSEPFIAMNSDGWAVVWYCKSGAAWTHSVDTYGFWSELSGDWLYQARNLLYGTDAQRLAAATAALAVSAPESEYTMTIKPLVNALHVEHDPQYFPPVRAWRVAPIATGKRPYYALNAQGTAVGKKLGDVDVDTICDGAKRLASTTYYWVPVKGGYSVCRQVP